jgi:hypothetical protein
MTTLNINISAEIKAGTLVQSASNPSTFVRVGPSADEDDGLCNNEECVSNDPLLKPSAKLRSDEIWDVSNGTKTCRGCGWTYGQVYIDAGPDLKSQTEDAQQQSRYHACELAKEIKNGKHTQKEGDSLEYRTQLQAISHKLSKINSTLRTVSVLFAQEQQRLLNSVTGLEDAAVAHVTGEDPDEEWESGSNSDSASDSVDMKQESAASSSMPVVGSKRCFAPEPVERFKLNPNSKRQRKLAEKRHMNAIQIKHPLTGEMVTREQLVRERQLLLAEGREDDTFVLERVRLLFNVICCTLFKGSVVDWTVSNRLWYDRSVSLMSGYRAMGRCMLLSDTAELLLDVEKWMVHCMIIASQEEGTTAPRVLTWKMVFPGYCVYLYQYTDRTARENVRSLMAENKSVHAHLCSKEVPVEGKIILARHTNQFFVRLVSKIATQCLEELLSSSGMNRFNSCRMLESIMNTFNQRIMEVGQIRKCEGKKMAEIHLYEFDADVAAIACVRLAFGATKFIESEVNSKLSKVQREKLFIEAKYAPEYAVKGRRRFVTALNQSSFKLCANIADYFSVNRNEVCVCMDLIGGKRTVLSKRVPIVMCIGDICNTSSELSPSAIAMQQLNIAKSKF